MDENDTRKDFVFTFAGGLVSKFAMAIEEKIVDLHKHKRDLADSLLEGADMSGKVSTTELLRLIQAQPLEI